MKERCIDYRLKQVKDTVLNGFAFMIKKPDPYLDMSEMFNNPRPGSLIHRVPKPPNRCLGLPYVTYLSLPLAPNNKFLEPRLSSNVINYKAIR